MKTITLLLTALILTSVFSGCQKDNQKIKNGSYSGSFTVTYLSDSAKGSTTLVLKNGKFTCTGNENRIPAGGSGTYSTKDGKITFLDQNFWTADFDWNLILSGEYYYSFDGQTLKIWADKNNVGHYEYDLKRVF